MMKFDETFTVHLFTQKRLFRYLKFKSTLHQNRLEEARECSIRDRGVITASLANLATSSKRESCAV